MNTLTDLSLIAQVVVSRNRRAFRPQKERKPLTAASLLLTLAGAYRPIKISFHSSSRPLVMACPARKTERAVRS